MSITWHKAARARALEVLSGTLPQLQLQHGTLLVWDTIGAIADIDSILPRNRHEIGLDGYVGEYPLSHFIADTISADLITAVASGR